MQAIDVMKSQAEKCERMAGSVGDPDARDTWRRMAERWQHCAHIAQSAEDSVARNRNERERRTFAR